ncbi:MAG TPA: metallophosphoesterase [Solirubrobacteraceae bacterium]|nr:metallophosphoesterase [Solirubrobacteraceae bacterium]
MVVAGFALVLRIGFNGVVRALVISDTHFGAWTGEDILREPENLALLGPHLDVDEVIMLGDLFDLLFASSRDAFSAAEGLFGLLRERLQGKRFVFLAGNHDHHFVQRRQEELLELELAARPPAGAPGSLAGGDSFRRFLERRLAGVEVDVRYPTYTFGGVLCTHGHYLDFYAAQAGAVPGRLLERLMWSIAVGPADREPTIEDLEANTQILTGLLFTIAQLPNGTRAQRQTFADLQALERTLRICTAPVRRFEGVAARLGQRLAASRALQGPMHGRLATIQQARASSYETAMASEMERRRRIGAPGGGELARRALGQTLRPRDPYDRAVAAFEQVVMHLGWARDTDKIVFAHTHQPLEDVRGPSGTVRYWNTGSWIYEPDFTTHEAYVRYLENAWPGTAVLIDTDEPCPRLLQLREHLNPLRADGGP